MKKGRKCDMVGCKCTLTKRYYESVYCPAHYPKTDPTEVRK